MEKIITPDMIQGLPAEVVGKLKILEDEAIKNNIEIEKLKQYYNDDALNYFNTLTKGKFTKLTENSKKMVGGMSSIKVLDYFTKNKKWFMIGGGSIVLVAILFFIIKRKRG